MRTARAVWDELPVEWKRKLVEFLDYKSRSRVRALTKTDKRIVDSCPNSLQLVSLRTAPYTGNGHEKKAGLDVAEHGKPEVMTEKWCPEDDIIRDFMRIFRHRKSFARKVEFNFYYLTLINLTSKLAEKFSECGGKIRAETFVWNCYLTEDGDNLRLLKYFDPNVLNSILIRYGLMRKDTLDQFFEMDQFKNAKKVDISCEIKVTEMTKFVHLDNFRIMIPKLSAENGWTVIRTFIDRPAVLHAGFAIYTLSPMECDNLLTRFGCIPDEHNYLRRSTFKFVKHFEMATARDHIFAVRLSKYWLEGTTCRKSDLDEDLKFLDKWDEVFGGSIWPEMTQFNNTYPPFRDAYRV
ncbi:unnamed protein product [Caenorhabditis sp. 36 PRJEB53466]|nr:unnamed protein product [Caenorhabditis sp. 36 PRJEB53466]